MDVCAILEMLKPTTSHAPVGIQRRSSSTNLTDSETSFDSNDSQDSMDVVVLLSDITESTMIEFLPIKWQMLLLLYLS